MRVIIKRLIALIAMFIWPLLMIAGIILIIPVYLYAVTIELMDLFYPDKKKPNNYKFEDHDDYYNRF